MNYIIETNLGIVFVYVVYLLFLQHENDFTSQRRWLLTGIVCALVVPLIEIQTASNSGPVALSTLVLPEATVTLHSSAPLNIMMIVYLAVGFIVAVPLLFHAFKIYWLSKNQSGTYKGDYYIIETNENRPSWSFFRLIYIGRANELSDEDKDLVLKHEMLHGRLLHSLDMILITVLCIVFWFNPILWFYRRTMAKVHEFEVDATIAQQAGAENYSLLLAKTALSRNGFLLAHHFNQSFILKRINMINMIKSKVSNWKLGGLVTIVVIYFAVIACTEPLSENNATTEKDIDRTGEVFTIVEKGALPTKGITAFYEELGNLLEYPEQARKMGVEGKVFVEFIVNKDGRLSDFKVLKGIGAGCDNAALEAMRKINPWIGATHEGTPVRQRMVLPITFKLDD